ncbi:MAG: Ku protein [Acidobacteriota bacterium]
MAARAIWKGVVRFGSAEVPVKLYSAVEDRTVHFRLLHAEDRVRVRQRMVDPRSGDEVPREEVRRGYEVEPGTFVVLDDEDLAEVQPEPSRTIEVTRFVEPARLDHRWYDRPYYLGPDDGAGHSYFALARALAGAGREGVARWVMRNKQYRGALRAEGEYLMLISLRAAGEVIATSELEAPRGRELEGAEVEMAERLVEAMADEFDPTRYREEYRERVLELIEAKIEGRVLEFPSPEEREEAPSLVDALESSLARLREDLSRPFETGDAGKEGSNG